MLRKWTCCSFVALFISLPSFAVQNKGPAICEAALIDLIEIEGGAKRYDYSTGTIHYLNLSHYFETPSPVSDMLIRSTLMSIVHTVKMTSTRALDLRVVLVDQFLDENNGRMPHLTEFDRESQSLNISMDNVFVWASQNNKSPIETMIIAASRETYLALHESPPSPSSQRRLQLEATAHSMRMLQLFFPR